MPAKYDPISQNQDLVLDSEPALYISWARYRNPEYKYHNRSDIRRAVGYRLQERWDRYGGPNRNSIEPVVIYKLDAVAGGYKQIFSYQSELAEAFKRGELTRQELYDSIEW